jgi:PAS domain S-box-containing protein
VIAARYRADGFLEFVNQTWRTYTGLDQDSLAQARAEHRWGVAIHPDDLLLVEAAWRAHVPSGEPFEMEQRMRRADGEYRWHFVRRVPYRNEKGEVTSWYGVAYDIEDQKRVERALQRSRTYLAEAQRLSKTGSFGRRFGSGEIFWSKEIYRVMGIDGSAKPSTELILQRVHPDDRDFVEKQMSSLARGGAREQDYEHRLQMPDGSIKYVHLRAHRQVYETGEAELVGAVMDVTAARQAQDALAESSGSRSRRGADCPQANRQECSSRQ